MDDLISRLSEIRSEYNCFNQDEEPYYRALSKAIRILSRQKVQLNECEYWDNESNFCALYRPSAERRGRWKFNIDDKGWSWEMPYVCDQCGKWNGIETPYCPNCGARMEE